MQLRKYFSLTFFYSCVIDAARLASSGKRLCNGTVSICTSFQSLDSDTDVQMVCCSSGAVGRYRTISADRAHSGQRHVEIGGMTCYKTTSWA